MLLPILILCHARCIILHDGYIHDMSAETQTRALAPLAEQPLPASDSDFLGFLGARVREMRSLRGMTRKAVAREADVSERHLAQLELGDGNISILLLRRIATALNVSLADLFATKTPVPDEQRMIGELLERLPSHRLQETLKRLTRELASVEKSRRSRIALIGLRGAGKSTLGEKLSREMNIPFVELDREIEKDAGIALAEIFSLYGQAGYRRIEKRTLDRVLNEHARVVLSIGGGVVSEKETYDRLLSHCFTVWIKAGPEDHMSRVIAQGDFRVMADNNEAMDDLRRILEAREPLYRRADIHLDTSGESVDESFLNLKRALESKIK
jgi:XRE family transcriptional regulator, aerobic/anaerobic benzoate catabolism transcriptional regulator